MAHSGYSSISVWLRQDSTVRVDDWPHPTLSDRVEVIEWDNLTIHLPGDDAGLVAAASLLRAAADQLIAAAQERIAADEPSEPDGPPDSYWADTSGESATYRRDMIDAGRGALLRP